jgi:hypothetical protein
MALFTFYRGIWGSGQPAEQVPDSEEDALCAAVIGPGHTINIGGDFSIFTQNSIEKTLESISMYTSCMQLVLRIPDPRYRETVSHYSRINNYARKHHGAAYVMYRLTSGQLWHRAFSTAFGTTYPNFVADIHTYYAIPSAVIYCNPSQGIMQEHNLSQADLCEKCGYYSVTISTPECITVIIMENGGFDQKASRTFNSASSVRLRSYLEKFANVIGNYGFYVCSFGQTGILPRVHAPHLSALEGILLTGQQIATYAAVDNPPADECDIQYNDDGACDSDDY